MKKDGMQRDALTRYLDDLLGAAEYRDYCPNGLQVEGRAEVRRVVCGVSACQALLDAAVARGADAVLVHHGWFWRGEDGRVTGVRKARLQTLLKHDISLIAYHLPLDGHPELGNNAGLAARLGWSIEGRFGDDKLGCHGRPAAPLPLAALSEALAVGLGRAPLVVGGDAWTDGRKVERIAWCTGGAQGLFAEAIALGVDAYLTGEASEPCTHLARESGVAFIAAGHHATERYGIAALARHMTETLGVEVSVVEIGNPV